MTSRFSNWCEYFDLDWPWNSWSWHQLFEVSDQIRAPIVIDDDDDDDDDDVDVDVDDDGVDDIDADVHVHVSDVEDILGFWTEEEAAHVPHEWTK